MAATANALIAAAQALAYDSLSDRGLKEALLYAAQSGGGGSGDQQVYEGAADPAAGPDNLALPAIYIQTTTGDLWSWDTGSQTWG